ncbi:MAG TPA: hypothetical protein V6D19_11760 [Stenomitos sp.]
MDLSKFSSNYIDSFEFSKAAYKEALVLTDEDYFSLSGSTKQLIEEILPIALLTQYLRTPELEVEVVWFNDSEPRDGKIRLKGKPVDLGFYESEYFVEVTTAVSSKDYLKREALQKNGVVFGGENIFRKGKRASPILSQPEVQEAGTHVNRLVACIINRIKAKSRKEYPAPCILVVNVQPEKKLTILDWAYIFRYIQIEKSIKSNFKSIYAIDVYNNSVVSLPLRACTSWGE